MNSFLLIFVYGIVIVIVAEAYTTTGVSLSAYPTLLNRSGDTVTLEWKGVPSPSELDFIAIYSPFDSLDEYYIGYKFLSSDAGWETGSGRISIPLVNLRSDYSFRMFRWSRNEINPKKKDHDGNPLPRTAHLLARSEVVRFNPETCRVGQIHLAFTDYVDEMRVMFVAANLNPMRVRWRKGNVWEYVETEKAYRYEREDMCDAPANSSVGWRDPGWVHGAVMSSLEKGTRYYYQVGSEEEGWSTLRTFVSRNGGSDETVAFLFGDMGTSTPYSTYYRTQDESISTMKWILHDIKLLGDKPSFISHIGDISYARGYSWIWDHFFTLIEPAASSVAYHVCIGNHEYDWPLQPWKPDWAQGIYGKDGGGECGVPYSLKFKMPGNSSESTETKSPETRNLYYSFNEGVVHFVYISTETNFEEGSKQHEFIKRDLESVNRSVTPFVVVQGHRPMYTTSNEIRDAPMRKKMMQHLEPLFAENNVTLALWGHVHRYERFCPLRNFECGESWKGHPINIVIGMAGQDWQPIWEPRADHLDTPIYPQPVRSMYRGGEFGYTRLVANMDKLVFSYVGNHDGEVHDSVEIHASGKVVSGADLKPVYAVKATRSWYFSGVVFLCIGVVFGFVIGFISRKNRDWTPVKSDDV